MEAEKAKEVMVMAMCLLDLHHVENGTDQYGQDWKTMKAWAWANDDSFQKMNVCNDV
jgi:hypothetical protein